ncbi:MAG: nuclear transport factor 2 family protein [bacterium]
MAGKFDAQEIINIVNSYLDAYQHRNIDALGNLVAKDESFTAYGSDEGESWYGWNQFKIAAEKLFGAVEEVHWTRGEPRVTFSRDGSCAWFAEELTGKFIAEGKKHESKFRLTGIVENRGGQWVMVQFHRSVPVKGYVVPYLETHGVRFD